MLQDYQRSIVTKRGNRLRAGEGGQALTDRETTMCLLKEFLFFMGMVVIYIAKTQA